MIDITKKYKTKSDKEVRLYAADGRSKYPVHGAIREDDGWVENSWTEDGNVLAGLRSQNDLVPLKIKATRSVWINVYPGIIGDAIHSTKESADRDATRTRIDCVPVTYEYFIDA